MPSELLLRAACRQETAHHILSRLGVLERWSQYGEPHLVGSAALELIVEPDIDMEIYCSAPRPEDGFAVLSACADHPGVRRARFTNALDLPDRGLYFQLQCEESGQTWKLDMWALPLDHPGPSAIDLVAPLRAVLTDDHRENILAIKEFAYTNDDPVQGIWVYRAVVEAGVRDYGAFKDWLTSISTDELTHWRP